MLNENTNCLGSGSDYHPNRTSEEPYRNLSARVTQSRSIRENIFTFKVPGGLFVTFIIPIEGSTSKFIIGHTNTIAYATVDWEEEKVYITLSEYSLKRKTS